MQQIPATFNAILQPQIPTLSIHNLSVVEHLHVAQICFNKPWCLEGFLPGHRYGYKTNKTQKPPLTEIVINGSLSAQKCIAFLEAFILKESV